MPRVTGSSSALHVLMLSTSCPAALDSVPLASPPPDTGECIQAAAAARVPGVSLWSAGGSLDLCAFETSGHFPVSKAVEF